MSFGNPSWVWQISEVAGSWEMNQQMETFSPVSHISDKQNKHILVKKKHSYK